MPEDLTASPPVPWKTWNRGDARPLLALHCSLAHAGAWAGLAARLRGVTVTALDQPGHGLAADWDGAADLHDLTTEIATGLAGTLGGGQPIDLIGHSFGATVCLRIALERPDLVRSLTLVEPVIFAAARAAPAFAAFKDGHAAFYRALETDREDAATMFHAVWGTGEPLADLTERQRRYIVDRIHLIRAQDGSLMADSAGLLRPGRLEAARMPVLLVEGSDSPAVIDAIHRELAARLPQVSRLIVPGARHMVPMTHPDILARALQAHLDAA